MAKVLPESGKVGAGLAALAEAIQIPDGAAGSLDMRQQWSALEAVTGGAFERANVYDIHSSGFEADTKIMQAPGRAGGTCLDARRSHIAPHRRPRPRLPILRSWKSPPTASACAARPTSRCCST